MDTTTITQQISLSLAEDSTPNTIFAEGPDPHAQPDSVWVIDREKRKNLGQVETPSEVAAVMASWLTSRRPTAIMDPAVGPGALLRACTSPDFRPRLVGIEIDPDTIALSRRRVPAGTQLIEADYLLFKSEPFPAIIANPPYVKATTYNYSKSDWETIQATLELSLDALTNVYALFILKIWHDLAEGGRAAIIVPAEFLNANYGDEIKDALLKHTKPVGLAVFHPSVSLFANTLTTSAIVFFDKGHRDSHPVWATIVNSLADISSFIGYLDNGTPYVTPLTIADISQWNPKDKWINPLLRLLDGPPHAGPHLPALTRNIRDFYRCKRGIITGANDYFCLSLAQIQARGLSLDDFSPCITKSNHVPSVFFTQADFQSLANSGRSCYLLDPKTDELNAVLKTYLTSGEADKIHKRFLTKNGKCWYKPEKRNASDILVSVFSCKRVGYVLNEAGIKNLNCFHGLYLLTPSVSMNLLMLLFLNSSFGAEAFASVCRFYGAGLKKLEVKDVEAMPCPNFPAITQEQVHDLKNEMVIRVAAAKLAERAPNFDDLCTEFLGL